MAVRIPVGQAFSNMTAEVRNIVGEAFKGARDAIKTTPGLKSPLHHEHAHQFVNLDAAREFIVNRLNQADSWSLKIMPSKDQS